MSKKEKVEKEFNPGMFMKNFITFHVILLYIVISIGDVVALMSDDLSIIFTRFLPVGIVAFVFTFFNIKSSAKKCKKSDEQNMRKKIFIVPLIVAIIVFAYGLYSVHSIVKSREAELSMYKLMIGEEAFETMMTEAANEARLIWGITAVVYLVAAEAAAILLKNKLNELMQDEPEKPVLNEEVQSDIQPGMEMEQKDEKPEETVNNIKWDL
ncbi:MAG: hypothetical protein IKK43_00475 [Clostridia bacterium]|nr:hypothetical protein [Clostridia bacterium]